MQIAQTNVVAKIAAVVAGLGLVAMSFASFAPSAKAATVDELQAMITSLQAQIAALSGGSSAGTTFTMDLTIGSTGSEVTALQNWLISKGFTIAAGATGYFGAQTQAALAKYQASVGITPAAGYFGPITRAKVNAAGGSTGSTGGTSGTLEGGAGSINDATFVSSLNNEKVGEDESDVDVAGLDVEADDGSDIALTAVKLNFSKSTGATHDFRKYADSVTVSLDGKELASVDATEFDKDNGYDRTVSLKNGGVIKAGDVGRLTVAVTGISNLDSTDEGDTWTLAIGEVRFRDADGATITETSQGDIGAETRSFTFESFATASNSELKISEDNQDVNDARTIQVDATDNTDDVEVLSFDLEAEGDSDLTINNWGVSVTVTGATNTDDVISGLTLWIDGEEVASADAVSSGGTVEDYNFDNVDYTIPAGEKQHAVIKADFNDIETTAFDEGDTITFALGEDQTDTSTLIDVEDESGEQLGDSDMTGSVTGGAFELRSIGIKVTFVSASESVGTNTGSDNDSGTFVIKYNVESFGGDVYVSDSPSATIATTIPDSTIATNGVRYLLDQSGTPTVADVSAIVTFSTAGGASDSGVTNGVKLEDGEDADFTLTVSRTNNSDSTDNGIYRALLKVVGWATSDTSTFNVYDFNLEDFKTDPVTLD